MDETVKVEHQELSYETIPNEFWPKCGWCGRDLGSETIKYEGPQGPLRICGNCREILFFEIKLHAPFVISEFLRMFAEGKEPMEKFMEPSRVKEQEPEDMLRLAVQRMRESQ